MTLTVGQELWFVPYERRWGKPHDVTVHKVGRKYAYLDPHGRKKIDVETLREVVPCGGAGQAYLTREEYEVMAANRAAWDSFRAAVSSAYHMPEHATAAAIEQAAQLLGLTLKPTP